MKYKTTIKEFLSTIESLKGRPLVFVDIETTGLMGAPYEVQITQVSCIVSEFDYDGNTAVETDSLNCKIHLTEKTLAELQNPESRVREVLEMNHYLDGLVESDLVDEQKAAGLLKNKIDSLENPVLVFQNGQFDLHFLEKRGGVHFDYEKIDTMYMAQYQFLPIVKAKQSDVRYQLLAEQIGKSPRDNGDLSSSLSRLGPALSVNMDSYHDSLFDCRLTMQVMIKMLVVMKANVDLDILEFQPGKSKAAKTPTGAKKSTYPYTRRKKKTKK
jgi:DNA polymerase III epsilon subunit-like protein